MKTVPQVAISKPVVLLTLEHKEREFYSKCFLAAKLIQRGFRVYLGSSEAISILAKDLPPAIFFHKSTHPKSPEFRKMGHFFCFLDEEGGLTTPKSTIDSFCDWRYLTLSAERQDLVFLPSERWKRKVSSMPNSQGVELVVSGWPRIDLWRPEFSEVYRSDVETIRNRFGSFVLFPTSFGAASERTFDFLESTAPDESFKQIQAHKRRAFYKYIELLKALDSRLPADLTIVVRPHPSESVSDWERLLRKSSRIRVIRDGDIAPWILASEALLQFGSTTVTQAALNGKLCIQFAVERVLGITDSPSFEIPVDAETIEDVISLINRRHLHAPENSKSMEILESSAGFHRDRFAADIIADTLEKFARKPAPLSKMRFASLATMELLHWGSWVKHSLQKLGFIKSNLKTVYANIPGGIQSDETKKVVSSFLELSGGSVSNFKVNSVGRNLVCVE